MKNIRLGMIGINDGNGHPYSWSAIFNGYDPIEMEKCSFPVIPNYLSKQKWPESKIENASVTHIWTQNIELSNHIAKATFIPNVVTNLNSIIGKVDGVLLARDDAEKHLEMSRPFLKAGIPIFIDKPFACNLKDANTMFSLQKYDNQIFTCSATRFSKDLILSSHDKKNIGDVKYIEGLIPKSWKKYAVHLIEPIIQSVKGRGELLEVRPILNNFVNKVYIKWINLEAVITTYNDFDVPFEIYYFGEKMVLKKDMNDTFESFKKSLCLFIDSINSNTNHISRNETLEIIEIIESGNYES